MKKDAPKKLIKSAFLRLMFVNILLAITTCVCGLIDNLFIGRLVGSEALAAVGFFSPVTTAVGLSYVVILGTQVLAGNMIGAGKTKEVNQLFQSAFCTLAVLSALFAAFIFIFRSGIASLLGVTGMAEQIDYYNNAGINTLIMKF